MFRSQSTITSTVVVLLLPAVFALCSCASQPDTTAVGNPAMRPAIVGNYGNGSGGYAGVKQEPGMTEQKFATILQAVPPGLVSGFIARHPQEERYILSQPTTDPIQREVYALARAQNQMAPHIKVKPKHKAPAASDE